MHFVSTSLTSRNTSDAFCFHGANGVTADVSEEHNKIFTPDYQNIEVVLKMCKCICVVYIMNCMSCTVFSLWGLCCLMAEALDFLLSESKIINRFRKNAKVMVSVVCCKISIVAHLQCESWPNYYHEVNNPEMLFGLFVLNGSDDKW